MYIGYEGSKKPIKEIILWDEKVENNKPFPPLTLIFSVPIGSYSPE